MRSLSKSRCNELSTQDDTFRNEKLSAAIRYVMPTRINMDGVLMCSYDVSEYLTEADKEELAVAMKVRIALLESSFIVGL